MSVSAKLALEVKTRDHFICRGCGFGGTPDHAPYLDADHIVVQSKGGADTLDNLQTLCKPCNTHIKRHVSFELPIIVSPVLNPEDWTFNRKVLDAAIRLNDKKRLKKRRL